MRMVVEVEAELTGRTLAEFEAELMGQLRMQLGPVVGEAVTEVAGRVPVGLCPSCGGRRERRGRDGRQVVGLFGAVWLQRSRVKCLGCGMSGYPADEQLGLEAGERYTLGVAEAALWVATENSYAKAAGTTKHLLGVEISHGQIHRLAQREGELVDQALEEQRETVFGLGKRQVLAKLAEQGPRPERVVVQADGTFVNDRATGSEMEAKAGIVYQGVATVSKGRRVLLGKRTYGGVESLARFGEKLAILAAQQGAFRARELWFVSDGSSALRRLQRAYFPTAVAFLDLWHLEHRLAQALGMVAAEVLLPSLLKVAREGDVDKLLAALAECREAAGADLDRQQRLTLEMEYVRANRRGIANYAIHGPQASGAIEKAMDVTVGRRLKAQGTSWYRLGAHHLLTLRILKQNGGWARYWQARRSRSPLLPALQF